MKTIISNEFLTITISSLGAEIQSIKKGEKEMMWQGAEGYWSKHAPVLFPICGFVKNNEYTFEGKTYTLTKHGFARGSEFIVESAEKEKAVFLLQSTEETKKCFPFDFELRLIYTLEEDVVKVDYSIKNLNDKDMYCSIGAHEAYACPGGIEKYSVVFENNETFNSIKLKDALLLRDTFNVGEDTNEIKLSYKYFVPEIDTLVFSDLKSRKAWIKNNETDEKIEICYDGFDYLGIWTTKDAEYICFEPWCGIPDFADTTGDITKKEGILKISAKETLVKTHTMKF